MSKKDLQFRSSLLNAEGTLGFAPDPRSHSSLVQLGAFFTDPVSLSPRSPAEHRAVRSYPGGVLLHSGFPNPGLKKVVQEHDRRWAAATMPVVLHLMVADRAGMEAALLILERAGGLAGLEVSFAPGTPPREAASVLAAAIPEWPVIAQLEPEEMGPVLSALGQDPPAAFSLKVPRGELPGRGGRTLQGRLYGPSLLPHTLARLRQARVHGLPVIPNGGEGGAVEALLEAGAWAVKVDLPLWRPGFNLPG